MQTGYQVSIVDYLKELGEDSSFEARKTKFNTISPDEAYTGSAEQNTRFLKHLIESKKKAVLTELDAKQESALFKKRKRDLFGVVDL